MPMFLRVPLLALFCTLFVILASPDLQTAEKPEAQQPNKPPPSLRNTSWSVAWRDAEGAPVKGRMSFTSTRISCAELKLGDVIYTEKGAWGGRKFDQAKISFKGTGKDTKGNAVTISGEVVNTRNLTATVTVKAKDGEQKYQVSGNP